MSVLDATTLERFYNKAEEIISTEKKFLVDRTSLSIVASTHTYTLPDYVIAIRRITYLGTKLDPLPARNFREVFQAATQQSKPFWYVYNNIGLNKIRLFPTPVSNVSTVVDPWKNISTGVIVEFNRVTDNSTFIIPVYLRRQLLKQYVAKMVATIEGPNQNLKLAAYFDKKWEYLKNDFIRFVDELYMKPRKLVITDTTSMGYIKGFPVLPLDKFGVSVDEGY
jgi:hypothetical protein